MNANTPYRHLRLPLVVLTAVITMGSGWGNPGCGSSSGGEEVEIDCVTGCQIEGTYQLTYADTSPLGAECDEIGLALPAGPLVLSRDRAAFTTTVDGVELSGAYLGFPNRNLSLIGDRTLTTAAHGTVELSYDFNGAFEEGPESVSERAVFSGTLTIAQSEDTTDNARCVVTRAFTATR